MNTQIRVCINFSNDFRCKLFPVQIASVSYNNNSYISVVWKLSFYLRFYLVECSSVFRGNGAIDLFWRDNKNIWASAKGVHRPPSAPEGNLPQFKHTPLFLLLVLPFFPCPSCSFSSSSLYHSPFPPLSFPCFCPFSYSFSYSYAYSISVSTP